MLLTPDISSAADEAAGLMNQLHLDPAVVEQAHTALTEIVQMLQGDDFAYMGTIQQQSFGGNSPAESLSFHHGLAHQVMTDTLNGVVKDVSDFVANLKKAVELVQTADQQSHAGLTGTTALVQAMDHLYRYSAADADNQHARNHHHDPFRPDGTPVEFGAGS
jgi:hypothetical protein